MNTYAVTARPQLRFALLDAGMPQLSPQSLASALGGGIVRRLEGPDPVGQYEVEIQIEGHSDHSAALNVIAQALSNLGYQATNAIVREAVVSTVEGALSGLILGGLGGSTSQDGAVTALAALAGGFFGALVGSGLPRVTATYEAVPAYVAGGWHLTVVAPKTQPQPRLAY